MRARALLGPGILATAAAALALVLLRPRSAEHAAPPARDPRRPLDVTFLVTSDTHVGFMGTVPVGARPGVPIDDAIAKEIRAMNAIAGQPFPTPDAAPIAVPRGASRRSRRAARSRG